MIEVTVLEDKELWPDTLLYKVYLYYTLKEVKALVRQELKEAGHKGKFHFGAFTPRGYKSCYIRIY